MTASISVNATIRASVFFTEDDNGLSKPWYGNVPIQEVFLHTKKQFDGVMDRTIRSVLREIVDEMHVPEQQVWNLPLHGFVELCLNNTKTKKPGGL